MKTVRLGILGTGIAAHQFALGIAGLSEIELRGVGSRSKDNAERFSAIHHLTLAQGNYKALIEDESIDLVYIATPAGTHTELALQCLNSGKPVLVEKPFAANATDAIQMISAATANKVFCMEAMWMRFIPAVQLALNEIHAGKIGDAKLLTADFGVPSNFPQHGHHWDRNSGGAWLDRGIYGLSLAIAIFGEPRSIITNANVGPTGCDTQSSAIMIFDNDCMAVISCSFHAYSSNEAVIAGTSGRIRLAEPFIRPNSFGYKAAPRFDRIRPNLARPNWKERIKQLGPICRLKSLIASDKVEFHPFTGNGYCHEAIEAARCIREGLLESPLMPWQQTLQVMRASDRVRSSWV